MNISKVTITRILLSALLISPAQAAKEEAYPGANGKPFQTLQTQIDFICDKSPLR